MESNGCTFVLSKVGVKYMYFVLDKKNKVEKRCWQGLLKPLVCPGSEGYEMKINHIVNYFNV